MSVAGWLPKTFQFGGLGTSPQVARADIVTASLAGSGTAKTAARSDAISATGSSPIVGEVRMVAFSGVPTGWLLCDGSAVSRTTFSTLFAAIGTVWGVGDGSTTFNVPDLRGRGPVGTGTGSGLTARSVGQIGGEESHVLLEAELANHMHVTHSTGSTNASHNHAGVGGFSEIASPNAANVNNINTDGAGAGTAHNNMAPFGVIEFIIRAL